MNNPKYCDCGLQAKITDSRPRIGNWYRRYKCSCGKGWSSMEIRLEDGVQAKTTDTKLQKLYSTVDRDYVANKLIELAQMLLR